MGTSGSPSLYGCMLGFIAWKIYICLESVREDRLAGGSGFLFVLLFHSSSSPASWQPCCMYGCKCRGRIHKTPTSFPRLIFQTPSQCTLAATNACFPQASAISATSKVVTFRWSFLDTYFSSISHNFVRLIPIINSLFHKTYSRPASVIKYQPIHNFWFYKSILCRMDKTK